MDLFDTDRNPWPGKGGSGGLWERHNYDVVVPYSPLQGGGGSPEPTPALSGPIDLVVERPSFAIAFLGAKGNIVSGGVGEYHTFYLLLRATKDDEVGIAGFCRSPLRSEWAFHRDELRLFYFSSADGAGSWYLSGGVLFVVVENRRCFHTGNQRHKSCSDHRVDSCGSAGLRASHRNVGKGVSNGQDSRQVRETEQLRRTTGS
jgi:hypothetical protein